MMEGIYLLLGSNLGNRKQALDLAQKAIIRDIGIIELSSRIHESSAWGLTNQPDFLNQVVFLQTPDNPEDVLQKIQIIEIELGRRRFEKWGPRIIDIDILYFGNIIHRSDNLVIPHPKIQERRFTLEPLNEVAPHFVHPLLNKTNSELLKLCGDSLDVETLLEA